jgi:hypothetical protein
MHSPCNGAFQLAARISRQPSKSPRRANDRPTKPNRYLMAEFVPVRTIAYFRQLDEYEMFEGHLFDFHGNHQPASDRSHAFWDGWCNGRVDAGLAEPDCAQRARALGLEFRLIGRPLVRSCLAATASCDFGWFCRVSRPLLRCATHPMFPVILMSPSIARMNTSLM